MSESEVEACFDYCIPLQSSSSWEVYLSAIRVLSVYVFLFVFVLFWFGLVFFRSRSLHLFLPHGDSTRRVLIVVSAL